MPIAVTGASGQLGGELCRQLGREAVGLDLPDFDLTRHARVRQTLLDLRASAVINAGAYTQVDRAEQDRERCWAVNAEAVGCLAQACCELACPLVQVSTDYVFGRDTSRTVAYREDDVPAPLSVYGESKLAGERQAAAWRRHLIVRTCGLYGLPGPLTSGSSFVDTILRLGRQPQADKHLRVVGDQRCTPSYVPHVARAILFLLRGGAQGTFHVVSSGATTWYDFALEILRQAHIEATVERITSAEYGSLAARPGFSLLDTSKYHALDGPAMPAWQDALAEYLAERGVVSDEHS